MDIIRTGCWLLSTFMSQEKEVQRNGCSRQGMWHYVSHFMACLSPGFLFFFSFFFFPFSFLSCFYYYYLLTDGIRKFKKLIKNSNCSVPHIASPRPTPPCHPVWTNQNTSNLKSQLSSHSHFPLKINN